MENVDVVISRLTLAQKLDLMEALWADLSRDDKSFESPDWHKAVLREREEAFKAGKDTLIDWEEAKERTRKNVS